MKKLLTLGNVIKAGAVLFALIAFFMMFTKQLYVELLGNRGYVDFDDALFGDYGSVISFIGYLFILLSALAVCALIFLGLDAKIKKLVNLGLAGLLFLSAIFVFIEAAVVNGRTDTSAYHLTGGPVVAGIFAIIAALAVAASEFVPEKQLVK